MNAGGKLLRPKHLSSGRIAPDGSRSNAPSLAETAVSLPVRPAVPVLASERTIAREAPGIRSMHDGAMMQKTKATPMKDWKDITHYAGFDWAAIITPWSSSTLRERSWPIWNSITRWRLGKISAPLPNVREFLDLTSF
jgi:hypothetical protein